MTIHISPTNHHWTYFLALEKDLEVISRYVEFCEANLQVFSIELAHLLFAAASEVDVVAKRICSLVAVDLPRANINDYRTALMPHIHALPQTKVEVPRYGLSFCPWANWESGNSPDWWRSYNNVKHERDAHFNEATLKNVLNALGALHILNFHLYWQGLRTPGNFVPGPADVQAQLVPSSTLLRLDY